MRYKYKIYKNDFALTINNSKFSIEIPFNKLSSIEFNRRKIHDLDQEISEVDMMFDGNIKETLLEAIQRIMFYFDNRKITGRQLGIYFFNSFLMNDDTKNRIISILQNIEKQINQEEKQYFKYDFKDKEFVKRMMHYDINNFDKIKNDLRYDKDILNIIFKQFKGGIYATDIIQEKYDILIQFMKGNNHDWFFIKKNFVTDEIIDLIFESKYLIERKK